MSTVFVQRTENREAFIRTVFQRLKTQDNAYGKTVLLKPNIVSYEPYPTTTNLQTIESCVRMLSLVTKHIIVADGTAPDAGDSVAIITKHPLKRCCDSLGITISDINAQGVKSIKTRSYELEVSSMAFDVGFIISLPVLKSHNICDLTGALKNNLGFLSFKEKGRLHGRSHDVHRITAELNLIIKPDLYIVDAIKTLINTNEVRHGGKLANLGYMLAGTDPVSLDVAGLELLKEVEPRLKNKQWSDILHIRYAVDLGIGNPQYQIVEL